LLPDKPKGVAIEEADGRACDGGGGTGDEARADEFGTLAYVIGDVGADDSRQERDEDEFD